jgi:glucose-specific phosphotransferase system IIA component
MTVSILSPLVGTVMPLSTVPDPLFAQGAMGPGVAIDPPVDVVDVVAPLAGTLLQVFPHAFVVVSDDGLGVLVHLGIDTVRLDGAGFTAFAAKGDRVDAGAPVIAFDVAAVRAAGLSTVVPVVVLERASEDVRVVAAEGDHLLPGAPLLSV